jgi:hypothetical protein
MEHEQADDDGDTVNLCLRNVSGLTSLLQAVKPSAKQVCSLALQKGSATAIMNQPCVSMSGLRHCHQLRGAEDTLGG